MLIADSLQLALRAITAQRLRSFLTLLGIAVGIAAVILLTSIGEGIHRFVLGEFTQFGTNVITAIPGKTKTGGSPSGLPSSARPLSLDDAKSLERLPHVVAVTPNVRGNAEVEGNGRTRRTLIYGVNANLPKIFRSTVQSGQFLPADDESSARAFVVLGSKVKNELFGSENPLGQRLRIGGLHFRVIGVMARKASSSASISTTPPSSQPPAPRSYSIVRASMKSTSPPRKACPRPSSLPPSRNA
jgi:putative ABC transport system permease protein